jgi:hypothetical protein
VSGDPAHIGVIDALTWPRRGAQQVACFYKPLLEASEKEPPQPVGRFDNLFKWPKDRRPEGI